MELFRLPSPQLVFPLEIRALPWSNRVPFQVTLTYTYSFLFGFQSGFHFKR